MERGNKGSCYEEIGGWMERKGGPIRIGLEVQG